MPRINVVITINPGTPVNIGTLTGQSDGIARPASRYTAMMLAGASAQYAYILSAAYQQGSANFRVPATTNNADLVAQLAPSSSTAPGAAFTDQEGIDRGGIDMTELWIDGAHTGDKVLVSYVPKV